jgi:hypothetical protein
MNRVDSVLEHINAARETGVRKKMDAHVGAHGNQATQRVKSSDKEFIPLEKGTAGCRVARRVHRLGGWRRVVDRITQGLTALKKLRNRLL